MAAPASGIEQMTELIRELRGRGSLDGDSEDDGFVDRTTKGLGGIHRLRKNIMERPGDTTQKYVAHMRRHLGITDRRQFWRVRD